MSSARRVDACETRTIRDCDCADRAWRRAAPAAAQQRPLVTEDPETIGAGLVLIEGGFDYARDDPVPGLGPAGQPAARCRRSASASASARSRSCRSTAGSTTALRSRIATSARRRSPAMLDCHRRHDARASRTSSSRPRSASVAKQPARPAFGAPLRDQAAERQQRKRAWPRYHRLPCPGAGRQDRRSRSASSATSASASSAIRRAATTRTTSLLTASRSPARCSEGRRSRRARSTAARTPAAATPPVGTESRATMRDRRPLHARHRPSRRRHPPRHDLARSRASASPPAPRGCSKDSPFRRPLDYVHGSAHRVLQPLERLHRAC